MRVRRSPSVIAAFVRVLGVTTMGGVGAPLAAAPVPVSFAGRAQAMASRTIGARRAAEARSDTGEFVIMMATEPPYRAGGAALRSAGCASTHRAGSNTSGAID